MPDRPARKSLPEPPEVRECDPRVREMIRQFVAQFGGPDEKKRNGGKG
jgi:hypothetical protein